MSDTSGGGTETEPIGGGAGEPVDGDPVDGEPTTTLDAGTAAHQGRPPEPEPQPLYGIDYKR